MKLKEYIVGVDHLGIPAVDVDKAVQFYEECLGFGQTYRRIVMDTQGLALEAAFMKLGNLVVELFKPVGAEAEIAVRREGVLDHYAIEAPDLERCVKQAYEKKLFLHASTPNGIVDYEHVGPKGVRGANFIGPNGEVIELCQDCSVSYGYKMGLQGWSHLALKVSSLERSIEFYEKLGFEQYADGYLDTPQGRLMIGFVRLNDFSIEIIQLPSAVIKPEASQYGHIDHIAFRVKDAEAALYECRSCGIRLLTPMIKELALFERGIKYFMAEGPDGECMECVQRL